MHWRKRRGRRGGRVEDTYRLERDITESGSRVEGSEAGADVSRDLETRGIGDVVPLSAVATSGPGLSVWSIHTHISSSNPPLYEDLSIANYNHSDPPSTRTDHFSPSSSNIPHRESRLIGDRRKLPRITSPLYQR